MNNLIYFIMDESPKNQFIKTAVICLVPLGLLVAVLYIILFLDEIEGPTEIQNVDTPIHNKKVESLKNAEKITPAQNEGVEKMGNNEKLVKVRLRYTRNHEDNYA